MKTIKIFFLATIFLATYSFTYAGANERAWAWYDSPTSSTSTPHVDYQFNSAGGKITGVRKGTGKWQLTFPNLGADYAGVFHAVGYEGNHSVQVQNWTASGRDLKVNILAFAPNGRPIDGKFVVFFAKGGGNSGTSSAYQWANSPTSLSGSYKWNSKGQRNSLSKIGTGKYRITFGGMKAINGKYGNVQVTPYGGTARRAQVVSWGISSNGLTATIYTYDMNGNFADSQFTASYLSDFLIGQGGYGENADYGAYVWANNPTSNGYAPSSSYMFSNTNPNIRIARLGTGSYKVTLPSMPHYKASMAIASAYGSDKAYTSIERWFKSSSGNGTDVYVKTFDPNGRPMDAKFTLFYYTDDNILY